MSYEWKGELSDCTMLGDDNYGAHVQLRGEKWFLCVWTIERTGVRMIFHSDNDECWPESGTTSRDLAERLIDADKWRKLLLKKPELT